MSSLANYTSSAITHAQQIGRRISVFLENPDITDGICNTIEGGIIVVSGTMAIVTGVAQVGYGTVYMLSEKAIEILGPQYKHAKRLAIDQVFDCTVTAVRHNPVTNKWSLIEDDEVVRDISASSESISDDDQMFQRIGLVVGKDESSEDDLMQVSST